MASSILAGADLDGRVVLPGRLRLRRRSDGLERDGRSSAAGDREVRERRRRPGCGARRPRERPRDRHPVRRPQRARAGGARGRTDDRSHAARRGTSRSRDAPRVGAGRCASGCTRPREPAVRPRHHGGERLAHGSRRADAGRRHGVAGAPVRPLLRQRPFRRRGHGRGRDRHGVTRREPRSLLGAPRRRGQLRHRHVVRVRTARRGHAGAQRRTRLPARERHRGAPPVARSERRGAAGGDLLGDGDGRDRDRRIRLGRGHGRRRQVRGASWMPSASPSPAAATNSPTSTCNGATTRSGVTPNGATGKGTTSASCPTPHSTRSSSTIPTSPRACRPTAGRSPTFPTRRTPSASATRSSSTSPALAGRIPPRTANASSAPASQHRGWRRSPVERT